MDKEIQCNTQGAVILSVKEKTHIFKLCTRVRVQHAYVYELSTVGIKTKVKVDDRVVCRN